MKTFKGVVFSSIVFDVYLQINDVIKEIQYHVFEKGADLKDFKRLSPNFIADTMNWFLNSMLD